MYTHYNFLFSTCKSWLILCNFSTLTSFLLFGSFAQTQKAVITDVFFIYVSLFFFLLNEIDDILRSSNYLISATYALCATAVALKQFI